MTGLSGTCSRFRVLLQHRDLIALCLCIFCNAIQITVLFPFIFFMVKDFQGKDGDEKSIGFAAGRICSGLMIGRAITALCWGRIADTVGRKPVMYVGTISIVILAPLFGFAQNEWQAFSARFLAGLFSTIQAVGKVIASELVGPDMQAVSMSSIGVSWGVGTFLGPTIGTVFTGLWPAYPYSCPMITCGLIALGATVGLHFCVPETLWKCDLREQGEGEEVDEELDARLKEEGQSESPLSIPANDEVQAISQAEDSPALPVHEMAEIDGGEQEGASLRNVPVDEMTGDVEALPVDPRSNGTVWQSRVLHVVAIYASWSFVVAGMTEVANLWAPTSLENGGFGMSRHTLGAMNAASGMCILLINPFLFTSLERRFGIINVNRWCLISAAPFLLLLPQLRHLKAPEGGAFPDILFITIFATSQIPCCMAFTAQFMLINNSCSKHLRGQAQGLSMAVASTFKALAPLGFCSLLAWSLHRGLPGLTWQMLTLCCLFSAALSWKLPPSLCHAYSEEETVSHNT